MSLLRIFLADESAGGWKAADGATDVTNAIAGSTPAHGVTAASPTVSAATELRGRRAVVIVPAARMRTLALRVPPATASKLDNVVRFALEDLVAGDVELQHVVIAERRAGDVLVHVTERRWLVDAIERLAFRGLVVERIVAETDVTPRLADADADADGLWIWRTDGGFVIERNGKVTVLDQSSDALPSGLLLAIDRQRDGSANSARKIVVRGPADLASRTDSWSRATGAAFRIEPEWSWRDATDATLETAVSLLTPALHIRAATNVASRPRWLRRAIGWSVAALLLHTAASTASWATLKWKAAALDRDSEQMIKGVAADLTGDISNAWRTRYADFRHRLGKTAPNDALPMLADAASGLREISPGAVRLMSFEAGQLTIDFERSATALVPVAVPRWTAAGLSVLQAESPAGIRVRLSRE